MYCEQCGSKIRDDAKFCRECGIKITCGASDRKESSKASSHNVKGVYILLSVFLGILLFVAVFVITLSLLTNKDESQNKKHIEPKSITETYSTIQKSKADLSDKNKKSTSDYFESIGLYISNFNRIYENSTAFLYNKMPETNLEKYADDNSIFRYDISDWITFIAYPNDEIDDVKCVTLKFDPSGQKGLWILEMLSMCETLLESVYSELEDGEAAAVIEYYENTLYTPDNGWNWPYQGEAGVYHRGKIDCELRRALNSLLFEVRP